MSVLRNAGRRGMTADGARRIMRKCRIVIAIAFGNILLFFAIAHLIGAALICDASGAEQDGNDRVPHGPTFMTSEWRELYEHAPREGRIASSVWVSAL